MFRVSRIDKWYLYVVVTLIWIFVPWHIEYTRTGDAKKASAQTSFRCILYYLSLYNNSILIPCTFIYHFHTAFLNVLSMLSFTSWNPFHPIISSIIKIFSFCSFASFCNNNFTQDIMLKINLSIIFSHALIILLHLECLADLWTRCSLTMRYTKCTFLHESYSV